MTAPVWDERFEGILRNHLRLLASSASLRPEANLGGLGLDSLTSIQLLISLEEAYEISVPDELLSQDLFETAGSLWTAIDSLA